MSITFDPVRIIKENMMCLMMWQIKSEVIKKRLEK